MVGPGLEVMHKTPLHLTVISLLTYERALMDNINGQVASMACLCDFLSRKVSVRSCELSWVLSWHLHAFCSFWRNIPISMNTEDRISVKRKERKEENYLKSRVFFWPINSTDTQFFFSLNRWGESEKLTSSGILLPLYWLNPESHQCFSFHFSITCFASYALGTFDDSAGKR